MKYTKEKLAPIVAKNFSIAGVLRDLGLRPSGGNHSHIGRVIKKHELDTSHFTGRAHNRGKIGQSPSKAHWTEVLIKRRPDQLRDKAYRLRRALIESGREYVCEKCGLGPEWQGEELRLEVDHINSDWSDNTPENVRFLCPNCHSLRGTSNTGKPLHGVTSGHEYHREVRRKRREAKAVDAHVLMDKCCVDCNKTISPKADRCKSCEMKYRHKDTCKRPDKDQLIADKVELKSFCAIGRKYGVSDNAVRKWFKFYELMGL